MWAGLARFRAFADMVGITPVRWDRQYVGLDLLEYDCARGVLWRVGVYSMGEA